MLPSLDAIIVMGHIGKIGLSQDDRYLGESVIESVQSLTLERSLQIVSDDVNLVETGPESFGRGNIADVTETEDILVFAMT
jgi:hypothetical protein